MTSLQKAREIAELIAQKGGRAYFVGGFVRDRLMGKKTEDIDVEVHGIEPEVLSDILEKSGKTLEMGKSFGIYSLRGYNIDIALPRTERPLGSGHRDFDVKPDPHLGTLLASKRRDFTVNSLMQDILTDEITDHFGGREDLKKGILRHVNEATFPQDPLRVLRLAQFASRFGFTPHKDTIELCKKIDLSALSRERVFDELKKALLLSEKPSVFFETLRKTDSLSQWFPELEELIGIEQNPVYHSEGDVWTHTMMVVDEGAKLRDKVSNPLWFMLACLYHDLGKIVSTVVIDGVIHAYNHETEGLPIVEKALKRLTGEKALKKYVLNLCSLHMKPRVVAGANSSVKTTNRMFDDAIEPMDLIYISLADSRGKIPPSDEEKTTKFLLERYETFKKTMEKPYVTGQDLTENGIEPNENFKEILAHAHKLHLAGVDKESALKDTLAFARKRTQGILSD